MVEPTQKSKYATLGKYSLVKPLGSGYNSKVKLGFDSEANKYHAVKIIKHSHPSVNLKTLKKEIEMLTTLNHPNIVNLIEFHESIDYIKKNGKTYKAVAIIMELVPGGELFEYVADSGRFSEEVARTYFKSLIETLEYCHGKGITHRDLKPENLLFDENFNLKVADFGFATLIAGKDDSGLLYTILGTESYMAPEIHMRKPYSGPVVDLFAAGIILFIMISGTPPFAKAMPKADPHFNLLCTGKQDVFWKAHERNKPKKAGQETFYSPELRDLMTAMFAPEASARLTIEQIKEHAWFKGETVDSAALKAEFIKRKKLVDAELKAQREIKEKEKAKAKMQAHHAQGAFQGVKPFRSLETEMEASIDKDLESKVNFEAKREIQDYQDAGFRATTEVFSVLSIEGIFKLLCSLSKKHLADFSVSQDTYKIKGKIVQDEGSCNLNIVMTKVDENTTCIEFHKTSGNVLTFYKGIEEIKKGLPVAQAEQDSPVKAE